MFFSGISWFAVIIGAVAAFLGGWLWYSDFLFGRQWRKERGVSEEAAAKGLKGGSLRSFGVVFLGYLVMATASASLLNSLFIVAYRDILLLSVALWAAFVLVTKANDVLFGSKSWKLYAIEIGQDLFCIVLIFTVISFVGR